MTRSRLLVGFGSWLRGDDAAGLVVAEHLDGKLPGVRVAALELVPIDLYTWWSEGSEVILVDAARGAAPGAVHRFDALQAPLPTDLLRLSTHGGGLPEAVEVARALSRLPASLQVFAIEGERFALGERISQTVARAVLHVSSCVLEEWGPRRA